MQKAKTESRTSTARHVQEKEDGNPYYSAFSTEQESANLTSKKKDKISVNNDRSFIFIPLISL